MLSYVQPFPLAKPRATGFRSGLPTTPTLRRPFDESDLRQVVDATYQQLLNKVPLEQQRMVVAESKLRDGQIDLAGFVEAVALGDDFQERLFCMAPLRAATAASLALLGRASTPSETSRFLRIRFESGQPAAVSDFLAQRTATTESSSASRARWDEHPAGGPSGNDHSHRISLSRSSGYDTATTKSSLILFIS